MDEHQTPQTRTAPLLLDYGTRGRPSWFGRPWLFLLFGYFAALVALALIAMHVVYFVQTLDFFDRFSGSQSSISASVRNGLSRWQIWVLIAFQTLQFVVAITLLIASGMVVRERPGALRWLRHYAFWQIVCVLPNLAVVVAFADAISWSDTGIADMADGIRFGAVAETAAAILWSFCILLLLRWPRVTEYWRAIESPEVTQDVQFS